MVAAGQGGCWALSAEIDVVAARYPCMRYLAKHAMQP
jgi:hypothetical protein